MFVGLSKYFDVIIARNQTEIRRAIDTIQMEKSNGTVGFIPTMGALHEGHMSLIEMAGKECDIVVCSIFVNPTQFNNPKDLETYPRTVEEDQRLLEENGCDILLLPTFEAVYPNGTEGYSIDLEGLDKGMEGTFRPGHFNGVCMVVQRFLEMVEPDRAYFGNKDFQQLAIVRKMAQIRQLPVKIVGVPIKRSESGLALSSRNALLNPDQLASAPLIFQALKSGLQFALSNRNAADIKRHILSQFEKTAMEVEYVAIIDNDTLEPQEKVTENTSVCIVVFSGSVRLLDNMQFADVLHSDTAKVK